MTIMVKIINDEFKAKKYMDVVKKAFDMYKISSSFKIEDTFEDKNVKNLMKLIEENSNHYGTDVHASIIKENLLGNKTMSEIAKDNGFSVTYVYGLRKKILKDFASILFEVIII